MNATGGLLTIKEAAKVLGHQVGGSKLRRVFVSEALANACIQTLQRLRCQGVPPRSADKYISAKALKRFVYGCEVSHPAAGASSKVKYAFSKTLWTKTRTYRNPEVLSALCRKGHLVDPEQAVWFQTIFGLRRLFRSALP